MSAMVQQNWFFTSLAESSGPITLEKKLGLGPQLADFIALNQQIHSMPTTDTLPALPDLPPGDTTVRLALLYIVHGGRMILKLDANDEYSPQHTWSHKDVDIDSSSRVFKALEKRS